MVDPSSRGFGLHAGLRPVFTCMQSLFQPRVGDGTSISFWEVNWSGHGSFWACYPSLYALALEFGATVRTVWEANWLPSLPRTLSNQRYVNLIALYTILVPSQLPEREPDAWVWGGGCFSVRAVYRHFQELESTSDSPTLLKCCRLFWKCQIPLKIKLFGWLLLCQRLMTQSLRQRFYPNALVECPSCTGVVEDCSHLFFDCQFAHVAWRATPTCGLVTSSADSFWRAISWGPCRRASE